MRAIFLALVAAALVAACGLNRPAVERQSFLLQPERLAAPRAAAIGSLRLAAFEVAEPFAGRGFVYRREEQRFETDFYNEFAAEPGDVLANATAEWLRKSGLVGQVLAAHAVGPAEVRLEAAVTALYIDFAAGPPVAVLALRWRIGREGGGIREFSHAERVPLGARTPAAAAQAQQEALRRALEALETALAGVG